MAPLYVISDVHGHRAELRDTLREAGLVDHAGRWSGGDARLWFLGDYVDRGPDGVGVIDDVRRLAVAARATGGEVGTLLGNHEVQLLAAYHFGTTPVVGWNRAGGHLGAWRSYGGRDEDMRRLTADHVAWISRLPAVAVIDGHVLVHADTTRYLEFGSNVDTINKGVTKALFGAVSADWVEFFEQICDRGAFRNAESTQPNDPVSTMLRTLGGEFLVHGHSTLTSHFGVAPQDVKEAVRYAGGRVIAIDGGVHEGGRLLLTRLT
jgi:hypothetical protein